MILLQYLYIRIIEWLKGVGDQKYKWVRYYLDYYIVQNTEDDKENTIEQKQSSIGYLR